MGLFAIPAPDWLDTLRAYPRWLVLLCVTLLTAGLIALFAKPLKWALYLGLAAGGALLVIGFAVWLEG